MTEWKTLNDICFCSLIVLLVFWFPIGTIFNKNAGYRLHDVKNKPCFQNIESQFLGFIIVVFGVSDFTISITCLFLFIIPLNKLNKQIITHKEQNNKLQTIMTKYSNCCRETSASLNL